MPAMVTAALSDDLAPGRKHVYAAGPVGAARLIWKKGGPLPRESSKTPLVPPTSSIEFVHSTGAVRHTASWLM